MDFSIEVVLGHPPDVVQDAFLDPNFLAVTGTLAPIGGAEVLELHRDASTAQLRVRYRFTAPLSRAITAVIDPAKLTWVDDARVDLGTRRAEHVMAPDHYADRLECSYVSVLAAEGSGTRWTVDGALVVHAPLVGGRVAAVIVDGLRTHAAALGDTADRWLEQQR